MSHADLALEHKLRNSDKALGRDSYRDIVEIHLKRNGENRALIERYNCSLKLIE